VQGRCQVLSGAGLCLSWGGLRPRRLVAWQPPLDGEADFATRSYHWV
jgi:hypothetical protein